MQVKPEMNWIWYSSLNMLRTEAVIMESGQLKNMISKSSNVSWSNGRKNFRVKHGTACFLEIMTSREVSADLEMTIRHTEKLLQKCLQPVFIWCRERHMCIRAKSLAWQMFTLINWKIIVILRASISLQSLQNQDLWLRNTWWNAWCWEAVIMPGPQCSGMIQHRPDLQMVLHGSKWIQTTKKSMQHSSLKIRTLFSIIIRNWFVCVKKRTLLFTADLRPFTVTMSRFLHI